MSTSSSEDNDTFSVNFKPKLTSKPKVVNKKLEGNDYDKYLDALNDWIYSQGYTPRFESFDEVQEHFGKSKANDKLVNAYRRLVLGEKGRGSAPDINSWIDKTPVVKQEHKDDENQIFDNNQMNQSVNPGKITFDQAFPTKIKTKVDWDAFNKKVDQNYWNTKFFPITGDNVAIRYDPKYMRKDYFEDVLMKDPKKSDPKKPWTRTITEDLDHDGLNDIVIRDGKKRIRYFNGYSLKPEDENHSKQNFMLSQTKDGYYGNDAYLYEYLKKTPKVKSTFETTIEQYGKEVAKILKDHFKNDRRMTLILNHLSVASKLASIIKTYALTPVALLLTVPNLNIKSVKDELFKEKHSSFFIKIYKKGGEHTDKLRENMQQLANNPTANAGINAAIKYIYEQFLQLATNSPDNFIQIVDTISKSDNATAIEWRNKLFDTALAVFKEATSNEISED